MDVSGQFSSLISLSYTLILSPTHPPSLPLSLSLPLLLLFFVVAIQRTQQNGICTLATDLQEQEGWQTGEEGREGGR